MRCFGKFLFEEHYVMKESTAINYTIVKNFCTNERNIPMAFENLINHLKIREIPTKHERNEPVIDTYQHIELMLKFGSWTYKIGENSIVFSKEYYQIFEITPEDIDNTITSYFHFIEPDDHIRVQQSWTRSMTGEPQDLVYKIITGRNKQKYIRSISNTLIDENGEPKIVIGVTQDITERIIREKNAQELKDNLNLGQRVAGIGSWKYNAKNKEIFWSDEIFRIFELEHNEFMGSVMELADFMHPEDRKTLDKIAQKRTNHQRFDLECRICLKNRTMKYVRLIGEPIFKSVEQEPDLVGTIQDITELKEKQQEIATIELRNQILISESGMVFVILDANGIITYISDTSHKVVQFDSRDMIGRSIYDFFSNDPSELLKQLIFRCQDDPKSTETGIVNILLDNGKSIYLEVHVQNHLVHPVIKGLVLDFRDVTTRIGLQQQNEKLANFDTVTNLPRAHTFKQLLEGRCNVITEKNSSLVLVILDILGLKEINITLGREVGKQLMVQIMMRLKWLLGKEVLISRYSEDQFAMVIEGLINLDCYNERVQNILDCFKGLFKIERYEFNIHVNAGVSIFPIVNSEIPTAKNSNEPIQDEQIPSNIAEQLIQNASISLMWAYKEGRNCHRFYAPELNIENYKQLQLRHDLRMALKRNQFRVFYQPIVNIKTNKILAVEALIRWNHPDWGIVSPDQFIFLAEETGAIIDIGNWLVRQVCEDIIYWLNKGFEPIYFSVNFSVIQFYERHFIENILRILHEFDVDPRFLIVELKEHLLIDSAEKAHHNIRHLKQNGIMVALDNFGSGYSSLCYLQKFDFDIIKMDSIFLKNVMHNNSSSSLIARSIIKLCDELGIRLVAEGVENWDHLHFLKENNAYAGQGYIYSKPLSLIDINDLLEVGRCRPIYNHHTARTMEDRRKTFRLCFYKLLKTELTIKQIGEKKINVGRSQVLIKDIGAGGLCFISNIQFPLMRSFLLQFTTTLIGREISVVGTPVWCEESEEKLYTYGVKFELNDNTIEELLSLLYELQVRMKENLLFSDGNFTDHLAGTFFKQITGSNNISPIDFSKYQRQRF